MDATKFLLEGHLDHALERVRRALRHDHSPHPFFQEVLAALREADPTGCGGVWMANAAQALALLVELGLSGAPVIDHRPCYQANQELLLLAWQADDLLCFSGKPPDSGVGQVALLAPLFQGSQRVGVLQWFSDEITDDPSPRFREAISELQELISRWLQRFSAFSRVQAAGMITPEFESWVSDLHHGAPSFQTANFAARSSRQLLAVDRVWVWECRGTRWSPLAVSTSKRPPDRSPTLAALRQLLQQSVRAERFVYPGPGDQELPATLARALSDYRIETGSQLVWIEPLWRPSATSAESDKQRRPTPPTLVGALVCEQFQDDLPAPELTLRCAPVARQIVLALTNAQTRDRLQRLPGAKLLADGWQAFRSSRLRSLAAALLLLIGLIYGLLSIPAPLTVRSRGVLMPELRRRVFAPVDADVAEVLVHDGQLVTAGEPLLQLAAPELEREYLLQTSRLQERLRLRDAVRVELREAQRGSDSGRSARFQAQGESLTHEIAACEQRLTWLEEERRSLRLTAPLAGRIVSARPLDQLAGRPVARGEVLLEVMDDSGPWELRLDVPERRAGHVLRCVESGEIAEVRFRIASAPEQALQSRVSSVADRTRLTADSSVVLPVVCHLPSAPAAPGWRIGAQVDASIECGASHLLYAWGGEFYETLLRNWRGWPWPPSLRL